MTDELRELIEFWQRTLPPGDTRPLDGKGFLGQALVEEERFDDAAELLSEALEELRDSSLGEGDPRWPRCVGMYGVALAGQGELEEALSYLLEGFDGLEGIEEGNPQTAVRKRITRALASVYEELEEPEEAERWRDR